MEERLTRIEREVARISEIVSSLLSFSRVASVPRSVIDVREVIENAIILLQHSFREKSVSVDLDLPPDPLAVRGTRTGSPRSSSTSPRTPWTPC